MLWNPDIFAKDIRLKPKTNEFYYDFIKMLNTLTYI